MESHTCVVTTAEHLGVRYTEYRNHSAARSCISHRFAASDFTVSLCKSGYYYRLNTTTDMLIWVTKQIVIPLPAGLGQQVVLDREEEFSIY